MNFKSQINYERLFTYTYHAEIMFGGNISLCNDTNVEAKCGSHKGVQFEKFTYYAVTI